MKSSLKVLQNVSKRYQQHLLSITKTGQLTVSEWSLLLAISDGINTQEKLAQTTTLDTSTLSRQLKRLLEKGVIHKQSVGKDKRQLIYSVADQGTDACQIISQNYDKFERKLFDQWSTEEQNLLKILLNRLENSLKNT
ncbi:MarR family winged helix-turn-helix transcriptional regulator [Fructilactobacillus florum]|nr:MarR family transcriptional regulator [Fructilactobacillus florum]